MGDGMVFDELPVRILIPWNIYSISAVPLRLLVTRKLIANLHP